jgi:tetratricopeptide (TPR) repeat protein
MLTFRGIPAGLGDEHLMSAPSDCPYPGSRAFGQEDGHRFHGRANEAEAVAELWRINRLTIVVGPVASGKTSLVQAGVYPLMAQPGMLPLGRLGTGTTFPSAALPRHNPYTLALLRSWSPAAPPTRLTELTATEYAFRNAPSEDGVVFAAIDQVEDLFADSGTGAHRTWRQQFLRELAQRVAIPSSDVARDSRPRLHLLLVTRVEALDLITAALGNGAQYDLAPLTPADAVQAVAAPLQQTGRSFDHGAADRLVDDLRRSQVGAAGEERYMTADLVEPALLQAVCVRLWDSLPPDVSVISEWNLHNYGDVDSALAAHVGQEIAAVAAEHVLPSKRLRSALQRVFITNSGTRNIVHEDAVETAALPNGVLRSLVDRHLLGTEVKAGLRWYQLLSDRLIEPLRQADSERLSPPAVTSVLHSAVRALTMGEVDLARRQAERVIRVRPALRLHGEAESLLGNLDYEQDKAAEAELHYRDAASLLEAADDIRAAAYQLAAVGRTLLAQERTAEAVTEFRTASDRLPNDPVLQTELALALWQLGEGQAAVAILNRVLRIDGGNTEALRARGEILADIGRPRDAMLDLDRKLVRDRPSALAAHGLALAELGDHPAASREADDAVARAPHNGTVLLYAARAFQLGGDPLYAGALARRAMQATDPPLSPQHRETARKLAGHR